VRGLLTRAVLIGLAAVGLAVLNPTGPAYADTECQQTDPATGQCLIWIEVPGDPGSPGTSIQIRH